MIHSVCLEFKNKYLNCRNRCIFYCFWSKLKALFFYNLLNIFLKFLSSYDCHRDHFTLFDDYTISWIGYKWTLFIYLCTMFILSVLANLFELGVVF